MPERRTHDYHRNGITSLFAAFDIADGIVISQLHRQHRAVEFKKFLITIDKAVLGQVKFVASNEPWPYAPPPRSSVVLPMNARRLLSGRTRTIGPTSPERVIPPVMPARSP